MLSQEPQPGLVELIQYLESREVRMGLCTRNFEWAVEIEEYIHYLEWRDKALTWYSSGPVMHLLQTFLPGSTFAPIVTREFRPPKPDPAGILYIAKEWGLNDTGESLIMVRALPVLRRWSRNQVLQLIM